MNTKKSVEAKIVIVGAGPSGIAAASKLFQNGFNNVTILEAENRIGGRVFTDQLGDYCVDFGGQWVHGEDGNVAFELANPHGLLDRSNEPWIEFLEKYYDSSGNKLDSHVENSISKFFSEHVQNSKDKRFKSVGEYAIKMFDMQFGKESDIYKFKDQYLHYLERHATTMKSAETWFDMSTADDCFLHFPGDQMINWKNRGFSTILELLTKKYPDPSKELPVTKNTILNDAVTLIDYSAKGTKNPVTIFTEKGKKYEACHVIVTVPLGVLKEQHSTLFKPPLPTYKIQTIEGLGYGHIAKIYLFFEEPFWEIDNSKISNFILIWNEAEKRLYENNVEKKWVIGINHIVTVKHKPKLLQLWVSGVYAKIMENLSDDNILDHLIEVLHRFFHKTYKLTKPSSMARSKWYSNPHFRGTYSYWSTDGESRQINREMLEAPLTTDNPVVLFAGEATSKTRFSTVDGAIVSGFKAADKLIKHYSKNE